MRGWLICAGLICAAVVASSCRISINGGYRFDYKGSKAERNEIGEIDSSVRVIVVENQFGDVTVERQAGDSGWNWSGACWATDADDANSFLSDLVLTVAQTGETQTWSVKIPESDKLLRGVRSDLVIRVPASVNVFTKNRHGNTAVARTSGTVEISSQHGDVKLDELVGKVKVQNQHGKVVANGLAAESEFKVQHGPSTISGIHGPISINSQHGNVKLENVGAKINAQLQHGDIRASQVRSDVQFSSQHGSVELKMAGQQFSMIKGNASHSNIKVTVPKSCKPKVATKLSHGSLKTNVGTDSNSSVVIDIKASHTNVSLSKGD